MIIVRVFALLFLVELAASSVAAQFLLDWDSYDTSDWANGALDGTFANVQNSGIDLYVVVYGDVFDFNPQRPRIRPVDGTSPNGEKFLQFGNINFNGSGTDAIGVSFSFYETGTNTPAYVGGVSFQLIDVDVSSGYNDRITLTGVPSISEVVTTGRTQVEHDVVGSVVQAWNGSGSLTSDGVYQTELSDFEGAVQVSYGGAITGFGFVYDNGPGAPSDPVAQNVGILDISFTPVPEPSVLLLFGIACAMGHVRRRQV